MTGAATISPVHLVRCPICLNVISWGEELVCEKGHRFGRYGGVPELTTSEESEVEWHQHDHQRLHYDREFARYRTYRLENWQRSYIRRLAPVWESCGPLAPFLDAGVGGSAYTVIEAARAKVPAVGCDLSPEGMLTATRLAQEAGFGDRCQFVIASAEHLPFADGAFGGAAAIAVLEHVPDDSRALAELARVTRPGGLVFMLVPNDLRLVPWPLRDIYAWHDRRIGHLRHYSRQDLVGRAQAVGLEVVKTVYSAHWVKVWQLIMHAAVAPLRVPDDRLWNWMETKDERLANHDDGMHLNIWFRRA
jgi:ubiquinone/menaquinone biosynthesis C-methylase UbiE